jgi:hypothetical protein
MTKKITRAIAAVFIVATFSACSTVTITKSGIKKVETEPTYEESFPFYLGGLIVPDQNKNPDGYHIDGKKICHGQTPVQMQAVRTPLETLYTIITLTIYAPRTVKVWCNGGGAV